MGRPLPKSVGFDAPLFENKRPYISDVVVGDVARRPVTAVSVPVMRNGKIKYVLSLSLELGLVKALLDRQKLPHELEQHHRRQKRRRDCHDRYEQRAASAPSRIGKCSGR